MVSFRSVEDAFNIDVDDLEELAGEGGWLEDSYNFYMDVKDEPEADMSPAQMDWLLKIEKRMDR